MLRLAAALLALASPSLAAAEALREAAERGTLRLGVRADAAPFSASDTRGNYGGYSIDLCRAVVEAAARATGRPIRPQFVAVDAGNRLAALAEGRIDLLCEATSRTLSRLDQADFTLPTFVTGPGLMVRLAPAPVALPPLGGGGVGAPPQPPRRIGVL
ncbi:MAG: transporter substrate-binding domain-containing protein, partial [Elioraea sp.]|nr:transporter substrate-binding domain-containing protein [Elioraea sp.]